MRKIYDASYEYTDRSGTAAGCHLVVYKAAGGIVALARDPSLHSGQALAADPHPAARIAGLAQAVWQAHGAPGRFTWILEDPTADPARPRYKLVEFGRRPDGRFYRPRRRSISRHAVAKLVAQDYAQEWPPAWLSLPAQGLSVECVGCGCHLPISAVLGSLHYCAACLGQAASRPPADPPAPPSEVTLYRAREEFRRRAATHERKLGLTPLQRHGLFRALAGPRSLWEFRPAELRALAAQIEQFDSAAEVDEFLAVRLAADRAE